MAIQYGKKFLSRLDDSPGLIPALERAVGAYTIRFGRYFAVLEVGPAKYFIEDAGAEWRLCPLLESYWPTRVDTVHTIPILKPIPKPPTQDANVVICETPEDAKQLSDKLFTRQPD